MARLTDRQFLKAQIDLEPLGLIMDGPFEAYFCTPKGARIFARSGVDGIHFCFVRGFGETVFAVSPMNGRENCVHPVAKSFRDFLRLLLALHDAAAIEQAWQWNAAQLEEFEQENPPTEEQEQALTILAQKFSLRAMAEPWKYIHTVQTGFDYGKLRFSEEYYEQDAEPSAQDTPWKVTFEGTFWGAHGKPGKELKLGASFSWAGDEWLVPAAYVCKEGLVLDLCKRVSVERLFSFREKWELSPDNDGSNWSDAKQICASAENPLEEDFRAELIVNGEMLTCKHGCALCWNPLYPEGNDLEEKRVRLHYKLDELDGWSVHRICFAWGREKKPAIRTLVLRLAAQAAFLPGDQFQPERAGDTLTFRLPDSKTLHTLTVLDLQTQELTAFGETLYITELRYEITPPAAKNAVALRDNAEPIQLSAHGRHPGCAFGVIGGADGPTVLAMGKDIACSQVRREREKAVTWQLFFRQKQKEDREVSLLAGEMKEKL